MVTTLIKYKADVNIKDHMSMSPLEVAVYNHKIEAALALLPHVPQYKDGRDEHGKSLLYTWHVREVTSV